MIFTLPFPLKELIHLPCPHYAPSFLASAYSHSLNLFSDMHSPSIPPDPADLISFSNENLQEVMSNTNVSGHPYPPGDSSKENDGV